MKDLCKKLTASIMCFSFLSLQVTFAGQFDGTTVLPGVDGGAGADIQDHTSGLINIEGAGSNKADLTFGKDTVINWGHLNVGNGQQLNFINGNYAVLNNVLQGMSNFAGSLTGQNGMIIIANPNGMLMNGGSIETSGALILTTQDLYTKYQSFFNEANGLDKNALQELLKDPQFKDNTYSIISINNQLGGKVSGSDIQIIAKGIDLNNANITSTGDIAFTTSDGANFVAAAKDPNNTNGIKFSDGTSIQIANSSIKANDGSGNITLVAGKNGDRTNVSINGSTLTGNTNITANDIKFNEYSNSNNIINGNLTAKADSNAALFNTTVNGNSDIESGKTTYLVNHNTNNLDINAGYNVTIKDNSKVNGEANITSALDPNAPNDDECYGIYIQDTDFAKDLMATSERGYIHIGGGSVAGDAHLTADRLGEGTYGNITIGCSGQNFESLDKHSTDIKGDIYVNSTDHVIAYSDGDLKFVNPSIGDYLYAEAGNDIIMKDGGSVGNNAILTAGRNVMVNEGVKDVNTVTNINGDLTANAKRNAVLFNTSVNGNSDIESGKTTYLVNHNTNNLDINAGYNVTIKDNSKVNGEANITSALDPNAPNDDECYGIYIQDTDFAKDLMATSERGYIHIGGGSVAGDAHLTADRLGEGTYGNITIGCSGQNFESLDKHSTDIKGDIYVNSTDHVIAYSDGDLKFVNPSIGDYLYAEAGNDIIMKDGGSVGNNAILTAGRNVMVNEGVKDVNTVTNINGDLTANAKRNAVLFNTSVNGNSDIESGKTTYLVNHNTNNLDINAGYNVTIKDNSKVNGEANITSALDPNAPNDDECYGIYIQDTDFAKDLMATSERGYIHIGGGSVAGDAHLTADRLGEGTYGNITIGCSGQNFESLDKHSTDIKGDIYVNSTDHVIAYSDGDLKFVNPSIGDYLYAEAGNDIIMKDGGSVGNNAILTAGRNVMVNEGVKDVNTVTNINGDLTANAKRNAVLFNTSVNGNSDIESGKTTYLVNHNTNNLDINAGYNVTIKDNSKVNGEANITSALDPNAPNDDECYGIYIQDTDFAKDLMATSERGYIHIGGGSVAGDAHLTADRLDEGTYGNITIGCSGQNFESLEKHSTDIKGDIYVNSTDHVIAYSDGDLKFVDSTVGDYFYAESDNGKVSINNSDITGDTTVEASKGITIWNTDIDSKLDATFTGDKSVGHPADRPTDPAHDIYLYNTNVKGDAKLTAVNAQDGAITISNSTVEGNATATAGDKVSLWQSTVGKKFTGTSKNGDVYISALDGARRSEVGSAELNAGRNAYLVNSDVKDSLVMNAENGSIYSSDSTVGGFAEMNAKNGNISSNGTDYAKSVKANTNNATFNTNKSIQLHSSDIKQKLTVATKNDDATISVSHSTVGSADLTSNGHIGFDYSTSNGDLKATSKNDQFDAYKSEINGTAIINADKGTDLVQTKLQDAYITTPNGRTNLSDVTANRVDIDAQDVLFARSEINGRADVDADNDILVDRTNFNGENNAIRLAAGNQVYSANSSYDGIIYVTAKNATFKDSTGDLRFFNANVENKLSANTDGNISLDSNANNANEALMNKVGKLEFSTTDGDIKVWDTNVANDTKLTSENGNILLSDSYTKTADITNTNGEINVANVRADKVNTNNVNGDTKVSSKGNVIDTLVSNTTGEGNVQVSNAKINNATVNANGGKISFAGSEIGNATAATKGDGEISVYKSNIDSIKINTENGNITFDAEPSDMSEIGSVNATTANGDIKIWDTNFANNAHLNAVNGDIQSLNSTYGDCIFANALAAKFEAPSGSLNFVNSNITNDLTAEATDKVSIWNSTVGGKFTGTSTNGEVAVGASEGQTSKVGTADLTAKNDVRFYNAESTGDVNMTSTDANVATSNAVIGGNANLNAKNNATVNNNTTVKGNLTAAAGNIASVNTSTVNGNATVNAENGKASIWDSIIGKKATVKSAKADAAIGQSTVGAAEVSAETEARFYDSSSTEAVKMTANNGDVKVVNATMKNIDATSNNANVIVNNSKMTGTEANKLNALKGDVTSNNTNYGGTIEVNAQNGTFNSNSHLKFNNSNVTNALKATTNGKVSLNNSTVGGNFAGTSNAYEVAVNKSTVGSADLTSKWNNSFSNSTSNSDVNMTSTDGNATVNNSTVKGNANVNAKGNAAINGSNVAGDADVHAADGKAQVWNSTVNGKATVTSDNYEAAISASEGKTSTVGSAEIKSKFNNRLNNTIVNGDANMTSTNGHSSMNNATVNGNTNITAKGNAAINGSTVTGDADVHAADGKAQVWNSTVNGKAVVTSDNYEAAIGASEGKTSTVGSAEIKSKYNNRLYNTTVNGDANMTSTNGHSTMSNATVNGNANVTAKGNASINDSNVTGNATVNAENGKASIWKSTVDGKATVKSAKADAAIGQSTIGSTATISAETDARFFDSTAGGELKIKANKGDVNITNAIVRNVNATSNKGNINVNNAETTKTSRNHFTAKNGNVNSTNSLYLGDIKASAKNANFDSSNKGSLNFVDSTITENLTAKAHGKVGVLNSTVGNKLTAESLQSEVGITSSQAGSVDAKAKYNVRFNKSTSQGDVNLESVVGGAVTVNSSTIGGNANVKANGNTNKANVNITNTNVTGNINAEAHNDVNIKFSDADYIYANAGHDVNYETTGDMLINNDSRFELTGGNAVNVKTDGDITVDGLSDNSKLNAPNIGLDGANITSNNSNYNGNVNMKSGDDVTFTGTNNIDGDLTISASREHGFVALNGDSTTADNITVNNAQWIEARNVDTGHIEFNNFEIGHIIESDIDSTAFSDGDSVYIHRLNTTVDGQNIDPFKQIITDSATNVGQVIFYPYSGGGDNPGGDGTIGGGSGDGFGGGGYLDQDAVKLMNYLRDKGVEVKIGSDFAPIAFASHEGRKGGLYRVDIGDSVFRALQENFDSLHISDRFDANP